jgi:hypothetical protein
LPELLFQERCRAYESLNVRILWVFIGDVIEKPYSFLLNRVMILNKNQPLIHLDLLKENVVFYNEIIWLSTKEIQARREEFQLRNLKISQILTEKKDGLQSRDHWLEFKTEFRTKKWQAYMRSERKLLHLCAAKRTNLSLLPAEVGWPVTGAGFRKALFIWQAYVLMTIVANYEVGDQFGMADIIKSLKSTYQIPITEQSLKQLKEYMIFLIRFKVLGYADGCFEYLRVPEFYDRLEDAKSKDEALSLQVFAA